MQGEHREGRRDSRGRRIGYNWWRSHNNALLLDATLIWERDSEVVALGYATEIAEYVILHPRPTLKDFLIRNAGIGAEPEDQAA